MSDGVGFVAWRAAQQALIERALSDWVSPDAPAGLGLAMRYAVLDGGKRLRPLLVLAACEAVQGHAGTALRAACAVELIHAYSLVHDDMPCMDNDVLRRGKPTVHVQFGEAQALLAGDALQALAFELLVPDDGSTDAALSATLCRQLAQAAGAAGMAGGQAIDLASVGSALDRPALEAMHRCKTGALLQASVMMGATTGQPGGHALACLRRYGDRLGLAFQVVDDILDVTTDSATLGKTAGKDAACDKPTFVSLMGLEPAQACADRLLDEAHEDLRNSGLAHTETLHALADWVGRRVS
ncbi:MAG: farnesyl diphosphate synthase [Hydrogenophaga sp.]|jgi:farnesyl diphosphate synthase|uniref:polyprenyl synthetase family protein n=1 Tax=Hydrogenophaga sp. TaxID=1904254 RepID=UPI0008D62726|nr:farnesyl diphosphate synthase [Hydrogenophaga sp.]MBU4183777.1 polyprenyl synthetase family protein [Gammaproteobacteria bacterium]OGB36753.1 MAG: polyprenyl synthetase [Burkholderiales bacterium RIFCSPLOWO2_02_FULL_66_35]MBU4282382.1 polyprenyl synthetase family protein [Gammaproteobacteria bacterium]MBU4322609.1 polyprenyl synthetase family protein [Gammaproteobacteria bacterium]MBU4508020.1 polyprenyl synthetase family protein [Gammaproteobacteria bacterium]